MHKSKKAKRKSTRKSKKAKQPAPTKWLRSDFLSNNSIIPLVLLTIGMVLLFSGFAFTRRQPGNQWCGALEW
jgi:hypothetical protein